MPPSNFTARVAAVFLLMPLGLAIAACERSKSQTKAAPPPPTVTVARPVTKTVVDQDEYVGRFVAVDAVEVRARVSGYLEEIHFQDGQLVNKGDLLFTVDRRPFENACAGQASLAQAKANLAFAEADLARGQSLVGGSTITQQTFDQRTQAKRVAQANVSAQEAAVRQAELDLEFTELRAPVSGRIGDRRVSPGNLVTGGTTGTTTLLATITSIDPIRFEFTMDETSYLRYMRTAETGCDRCQPRPQCAGETQADRREGVRARGQARISSTTPSTAPPAPSAAAPSSPIRTAPSRPACSAASRSPSGPPGEALLVPDVGDRHRAGAQVRARGRRRECGARRNT